MKGRCAAMKKRRQVIFLFFILFFLGGLPFQTVSSVHAETTSVKEWLENPDQGDSTSQTSAEEKTPPSSQVGISIWDVVKMIVSTIFVIGLLLFVLKWVQKKGRNFANDGVIENIGGTTIGNQKSIQLVKIGNRVYIVGVGESVTLLKEIDNEDEIKHLLEFRHNKLNESVKGFNGLFLCKKEEKQESSFMDSLKNELLKVKQDRKKIIDEWKGKRGQDQHE